MRVVLPTSVGLASIGLVGLHLFQASFLLLLLLAAQALATEPVADYRAAIPARNQPSQQAFIQIRQASLALNPEVSVFVEHIDGVVQAAKPEVLPTLDDLSTLAIEVDEATLRISPPTMLALVANELNRARAPLRIARVNVNPEGLSIEGTIQRHGKWLPFGLLGTPELKGGTVLRLTPTDMSIRGVPLMPALLAADVRFAEIMALQSEAFRFEGRDMVLDVSKLLPEPKVAFSVTSIELLEGEVRVKLQSSTPQTRTFASLNCQQTNCPESYLLTRGGELSALGVTLDQVPTLITRGGGQPLALGLDQMQALLGQSKLRLRLDGAVWMQAPPQLTTSSQTAALEGQAQFEKLIDNYASTAPDALLLAAKQTELVTAQDVKIEIDHLLASTEGSELQRLPFLPQKALSGRIELSFTSLENLLNRVTFFYPKAPLRKFKVVAANDRSLTLSLESKPKLGPFPFIWSDTELTGQLDIGPDGDTLIITPTQVSVFGISALPLLNGLGLTLADLIDISGRPDVSLSGNTLTLKLAQALPPLSVDTVLASVNLKPTAAKLELIVGSLPEAERQAVSNTLQVLPAGMWVSASRLEAFGVQLTNTLSRVHTGDNSTFTIYLQDYPAVLSKGYLAMPRPGLVEVVVPNN